MVSDSAQSNAGVSAVAVFGGGCFWCTEAVFAALRGVTSVMPGYTGGVAPNPTYEEVTSGLTGHVEAIRIEYDPAQISYDDLLAVFFNTHDPTTRNRQGADVGTQYQSAIFYDGEAQKAAAKKLIAELDAAHAYDKPVVTDVKPLGDFYPAEDYHRKYYESHPAAPYCQVVIAPKLAKLQEKFAALVK